MPEFKLPKGPFQPTWESISSNYKVPQWYQDAKFGIFIHWGLYCVPAFGSEWYPRNMYFPGTAEYKHHVATYGPHTKFGYKDFIPLFKAEKYDPAQWAELFKQSGAKFVMPVAEHHDGFAMYDTKLSRWNAKKMGPKRDLVGELATEVRKAGLVFTCSTHRAEHWFFMGGGRLFDSDVRDPRYADFYGPARTDKVQPDAAHLDDWLARCCELVDKYKPAAVWFDWWIQEPAFKPYLQKFAAYYYNRAAQWKDKHVDGVAINYKFGAMPIDAAVFDIERGQEPFIRRNFWQTDTAISKNSWGYVSNQDYKTAAACLHDLIDIVSKNGALLLNIGPKADGTIPEPEQQILLEIGEWLAVNGEAIYGTRPWRVAGEGPTKIVGGAFNDTKREPFTGQDIRFTTKGKTLYATALAWPGEQVTLGTLAPATGNATGQVQSVSLLGSQEKLAFTQDARGLTVKLPAQRPCQHAFVLKITGLNWDYEVHPAADGSLVLDSHRADMHGYKVHVDSFPEAVYAGFWEHAHDWISWELKVPAAGKYEVLVRTSSPHGESEFNIEVGAQVLTVKAPQTAKPEEFTTFSAGHVVLKTPGKLKIAVRPYHEHTWKPINLASLTLKKA